MTSMTDQDLTNLRWMASCNDSGVGFLGPTTKRFGAVMEVTPVVEKGWAQLRDWEPTATANGYWLLPAGRKALDAALSPPSDKGGVAPESGKE